MRASLRHRGSICGWLVALLVAQSLLTAAHACMPTAVIAPQTAAAAPMHDCAGDMAAAPHDGDPAPLCKAHCEAGQQSLNSHLSAADVPQAPLVGAPLLRVLDLVAAESLAAEIPEALASGPPAGSPPLYLTLLVLRN